MWGGGGPGTSGGSVSRSCALQRPEAASLAADALKLIKRWSAEQPPGWGITSLYLSASNFVAAPTGASTITRFLTAPRVASPTASGSAAAIGGSPAASTVQGHAAGAASDIPLADQHCSRMEGDMPGAGGRPAERRQPDGGALTNTRQSQEGLPASLQAWLEPPGQGAEAAGAGGSWQADAACTQGGAGSREAAGEQSRSELQAASSSGRANAYDFTAEVRFVLGRPCRAWDVLFGHVRAYGCPPFVQEVDPEVMAALPEDIRRELRLAQMEQSSRTACSKPARELPKPAKGPARKRARKGSTNSQITSFYAKAKPA